MVTGAAGLVGQNLVPRLKARGYSDIVALDKHRANTRILADLHPDIRVVEADLSRDGGWEDTFAGADALIQLHAQIGGLDAAVFKANNVAATERVLKVARAAGVSYMVHISSSVVNSAAVDLYTETKKTQENALAGQRHPARGAAPDPDVRLVRSQAPRLAGPLHGQGPRVSRCLAMADFAASRSMRAIFPISS